MLDLRATGQDHPNIIKVYEFYQDPRFFYMVIELCTGGELFERIQNEHNFNEKTAAKIMYQVLSAVNYCHKNKVVHRDLKPENVMYESLKPDSLLKLVDFGTSTVFDPKEKMKQKIGTPFYIAPEVLDQKYDEKCDIWSCGVIMYILLCGRPPFGGQNDQQIMDKVKEGEVSFEAQEWEKVSKDAKNLILNMLNKDPNHRYSADQCLQDHWIKNNTEKI